MKQAVLSFCALFFPLLILCSCTGKGSEPDYIPLQAKLTVDSTILSSEIVTWLEGNVERLKEYGWSFEDGTLFTIVPFPNQQFTASDGRSYITDSLSRLTASDFGKQKPSQLFFKLDTDIVSFDYNDDHYSLNISTFLSSMDGGCCEGEETKSAVQRCIDYNGPMGNGQNDESTLQALINFIGSDCSYAVMQGLCIDEHMNGAGGCYNTHGGRICSELI